MVRYVRDEELIADALKQTRRGVRDVQRPTGTERAQTMDTAIQAAEDSTFARDLAEQLEGELGPLPGQIQTALGEAAAALEESGLARSEAATAVADASAAVADATQAITDAGLAQAAADGAATAASDAQSVAGAAQMAADQALADALAAADLAAGKGRVWAQDVAPPAGRSFEWTGPVNSSPSVEKLDGVEVARNLFTNPNLVGGGTWAEVRRNSTPDPLFTNVTSGASWSPTSWASSAAEGKLTLTAPASSPSNVVIPNANWSTGWAGNASASYLVENLSGSATYPFRVAGWNGTAYTFGPAIDIAPGETKLVSAEGMVIPAGSSYFSIRLQITTSPTPGDMVRVSQPVLVNSAVLPEWFDPNALAGSVDPDMRQRWLGTPNASGSVMEIERVRGLSPANCVAGVSTWEGVPAVRQIPTGASAVSYSSFPIPEGAKTSGTLMATRNLTQPLTGALWDRAGRVYATDPTQVSDPSPNESGSHPLRLHYSGLVSPPTSLAVLPHSGAQGSGEVRWTDIGLFAGNYTGGVFSGDTPSDRTYDLWINTTGGDNTPNRWINGAWEVVTDKAATDAAAAASNAQAKADEAYDDAVAAAIAAGNAQTAANGKNTVWYQDAAPTGAGHKDGDTWFDTSNGNRVTQWDGDSWEVTQFGTGAIATAAITNALIADATIESAKIANLDAAKITTGTLDAARIAALSIATGHLAANAVTAAKIAALTITAAEIAADAVTAVKIAADAVTAEKINAGAVTTDKLDALAVTAEKIAAGAIIADKIKANAITTAKLAVDAIDGMTITGALIRTAPTGQRMQFDISGLVSYDSTGAQTSRIYSGSGGMELLGGLSLAYSGDDRTGSISPGGVGFSNPDPAGDQLSGLSSASLIINRGNVNTTPTGFNLELDHEGLFYRYKGSSGSQRDLEAFIGRSLSLDSLGENYTYVQADESRTVRTRTDEVSPRSGESVTVRAASAFATPEIRVDASVGSGEIVLDAPKVTFQGDTDWSVLSLLSGWVVQNGLTPMWRIKQGWLQIKGRLGRSDNTAIGGSFVNVSAANSALAAAAIGVVDVVKSTPGNGVDKNGLLRINNFGQLQIASLETAFHPNVEFLL